MIGRLGNLLLDLCDVVGPALVGRLLEVGARWLAGGG
jgi:hypothetical protein